MKRDKTPLTAAELEQFLATHRDWRLEGGQLERTMKFPTFLAGIAFVQKIAAVAEEADHHPDLDIRYWKVTMRLFTHDAKALTSRDLSLANAGDKLAAELMAA